jgi:tricorn protease-like protein
VYLCDLCVIDAFVMSPDGRYVALLESKQSRPTATIDVVVVDTRTGREVRRFAAIGPSPTSSIGPLLPAWDAQSGLLLARRSGDHAVRQRIDLATGGAEAVGRELPDGLLQNSPDGTWMAIVTGERPNLELHLVDRDLEQTRLLLSSDGAEWVDAAWAPDGTAIALMTGTMSPDSANFLYEIQIIDLATGEVTRHPTRSVAGKLMWLPPD